MIGWSLLRKRVWKSKNELADVIQNYKDQDKINNI